jgi:hypothetical protein
MVNESDRARRLRLKAERSNFNKGITIALFILGMIVLAQLVTFITSTRALNDQVRASNQTLIEEYAK